MGALYGWYTRKEVIQHLLTADAPRLTTLAHCVRGNTLWTVQQWEHRNEPFIGCYLLLGPVKGDGDPYACGYKDMDESMHPYRYNCPVRYLDMAPETCPEWRAIVRREAARRATRLKIGIVAELQGCSVRAVRIDSLKPLRGVDIDTHVRYRIQRKLLTGRTFESAQAYLDETGK